jgi:uncharacterized repeat protein (TIGR01451 family)
MASSRTTRLLFWSLGGLAAGLVLLALVVLVGGSIQPAAAQGTADLQITKVADSKNVRIGENITYTITVTNLGPDTATDVTFGDFEPDQLNARSITCSQGTAGGVVGCTVESLPSGDSVTARFVANVAAIGSNPERRISNLAYITESATPDPNSSNNSAHEIVRIIGKIN